MVSVAPMNQSMSIELYIWEKNTGKIGSMIKGLVTLMILAPLYMGHPCLSLWKWEVSFFQQCGSI